MIIYLNSYLNKPDAIKENRGKSGVYRWINIINNESYVGSSSNLGNRFRRYYSTNYIKDKTLRYNSRIYKALLKYDYFNFRLEILEYCNKESLISREQHYIDLLKPEYNICKTAGSLLGFKHSAETLLKLKNRNIKTGTLTTITDMKNKNIKEYVSIRAAAKGIGVSHTTLLYYIKRNRLIKGIYLIKLKPNEC